MKKVWLLVALIAGSSLGADLERPLHPPKVAPKPELPRVERYDLNHDGLDDVFEAQLSRARPEQRLRVELTFKRVPTQRQLDAFVHAGGTLSWVFQSVSHGFLGEIAAKDFRRAIDAIGRESLLLVSGDSAMARDLDKATRNARARTAWQPGFAGSALGFNGSATTTIGVIDTGIDPTHSDLAGRMAYWKDFEGSDATPSDYDGHGTCVSSVAFGTGAGFEATKPSLHFSRPVSLLGFGPLIYPGRAPLTFGIQTVTFDVTAVVDSADATKVTISSAPAPMGASRTYSTETSATGTSPIVLSDTFAPLYNLVYSMGTPQNDAGTVTWEVVSTTASPYPEVGDGLPSFRGVAPGCQWAVAHAADTVMQVEMALDDLMTQRQAISLKVVNLSQSPDTDGGMTLLAPKETTLSNGGVLVVKSAGNNGRSTTDPYITPSGLPALVLTVGATNAVNQLTQYTSVGVTAFNTDEDMKPDLLAPGGSLLSVDMLCADSNTADQPDGGTPDQVPNDYLPEEGTSFSTPIAAGGAALVVQALEAQGYVWDFGSADGPKRVKSVMLATATETNQDREVGPSGNPATGRSAVQKDVNEGYGVLNIDAALEAVSVDLTLPDDDFTDGGQYERRAWGRKVALVSGTAFGVALAASPTADFDLYLYSATSDPAGNPKLLAASDHPVYGGLEQINYTPTVTESGMLVIKLLAGHGTWTMGPPPVCGNGVKETGEDCDDTKGCCSATCTVQPDQTVCPVGVCISGLCRAPVCGDHNVTAPETCDDGNAQSGDCCSATCQKEADGAFCTGGNCSNGVCLPNTGAGGGDGGAIDDGGIGGGGGSGKSGCGCGAPGSSMALMMLLGLVSARSRRRERVAAE